MSLDNSLADSISTFPVSPSDDQLITLTYGQLRSLIVEAVEKAIQPLQDRVESLESTVISQGEEIAATRLKLASLETLQESEITRLAVDIATDRRRLAVLEHVEPQPMQKDRGEILRALIVANGGKMLAKDARQKMHLRKELFSMLLSSMTEEIEIKPLHSDKRKKVLVLK